MQKTAIAMSLLFVMGASHAAPINYLEITSATIEIIPGMSFHPGEFTNMTIGGYDGSIEDLSLKDINVHPSQLTLEELQQGAIFWGDTAITGPMSIFTSETDGHRSGFAAPTGDITGSTLSLDLSSWTVHSHFLIDSDTNVGYTFNMGSSSDMVSGSVCSSANVNVCSTAITTTYNSDIGTFIASWDAVILAPFGSVGYGEIFTVSIEGNVSAVPLPASVWLFASGLMGLIGFAKRKKA